MALTSSKAQLKDGVKLCR